MPHRTNLLPQPTRALIFSLLSSFLTLQQAVADTKIVNCSAASLADAIAGAHRGDTLVLIGVCHGPVTIVKDALTFNGLGTAIIDGGGKDAVTVNAARQVTLQGLEIRNGMNGLVANSVSQLTLSNVNVDNNAATGILIQANSSAALLDASAKQNGVMGIDIEGSSAATFSKGVAASYNGVFGIDVGTASSATFTQADVALDHNVIGLQAGATSNVFISDQDTTISAHDNLTLGVTIVSGSHLFDFGGKIVAYGNGLSGVSVASRSGIDVDAAGSIASYQNAADGILLEELSLLNMFNTPQFSGVQGTTNVDAHQNTGNGVSVFGMSAVHMFNQAKILSQNNGAAGLLADNGSSLSVSNSTVKGNARGDILLSFGARAELTLNTIGTVICDKTSLIRGDTGVNCPKK